MKPRRVPAVILLIGALVIARPSIADQVYLQADFNDKTIDEPIGTGGAGVGEPVNIAIGVDAVVRDAPMGSPSLEISDGSENGSGAVYFEFLESAELTSGMVYISADLWFHQLSEGYYFNLYIREQGSSAKAFANVSFYPDGSIDINDNQGSSGFSGTYPTGRLYRVILGFDMDAGSYDVWLDGELVVEAREHGIADRGVGSVLFGFGFDSDLEGFFNVDAIMVTDSFHATTVEQQSWGRIKASFR